MERNKENTHRDKREKEQHLKKKRYIFFCLFNYSGFKKEHVCMVLFPGKTEEQLKEMLYLLPLILFFSFLKLLPSFRSNEPSPMPIGDTKSALSPMAEGFCFTGKMRRMIPVCASPGMSYFSLPVPA